MIGLTDIFFNFTMSSAPEQAPSSVECTAVSSTSLRIGWQPIGLPGQGNSLVGYTVLFATDGKGNFISQEWKEPTILFSEQCRIEQLVKKSYVNKILKPTMVSTNNTPKRDTCIIINKLIADRSYVIFLL